MSKHRSKAARSIEIHEGSENVYADLGYRNADEMLVKAKLVHKISEIVRSKGLTQAETAKILGLTQPKVSALLLPGMGQVLNGMTGRALVMIFFALTLGVITYQLTTPAHSFVGRHAGGLFIYAVMVMDAYAWARYRWERAARA